MKWTSLPRQWGEQSLWMIAPDTGLSMPAIEEIRRILGKHVSNSNYIIEHADHQSARISLPVTLDHSIRAIIGSGLRDRACAT